MTVGGAQPSPSLTSVVLGRRSAPQHPIRRRAMTMVEVRNDGAVAALALLRGASAAAVDVFTTILTRGPISRIYVARSAGLSQDAVTKAVIPMLAAGLVSDHHDSLRDGQPGRPANPLSVVPEALVFLGIKVNADE